MISADPITAEQLPATWRRRHLSPAEQKVVALIASGLPVKLAATELNKSTLTVRNQLQCAMRKLGLRSRYELIATLNRNASLEPSAPSNSYMI